MPQPRMTIAEAARHLGVTHRTIRSYIARELLAAVQEPGDRKKWLDAVEVEELRKDVVQNATVSRTELKRELLETRAALRRLRSEMDLVLRVLDMHDAPMQLAPDRAQALYHAAVQEGQNGSWPLEKIASWCDTFAHIQEEDFLMVARAAGTNEPWAPFLRLCVAMIVHVHAREDYKANLDLQMLHRQLTEGRRRLRVSALCYSDLYGGTSKTDRDIARAALLDSPESVREQLLRRARTKGTPAST